MTITFNANGWNPAHGELLDFLASHAETREIPVSKYIGDSIMLKGRDISASPEGFERLFEICEKLVALEGNTKPPTDESDLKAPEL